MKKPTKLSEIEVVSKFGKFTYENGLVLPYQTIPLGSILVQHNEELKKVILIIGKKIEELEKRIKKLEAKK